MEPIWIYEIIGYVASALVAISLMMTSILRLRIINLVGSAFFTLYGLLIGAIPVAVVNLFIVGINLFYLYRIFGTREYFRLLEVENRSDYLHYFLSFHEQEIRRFLPSFSYRPTQDQLTFFVLRDLVPAGLFIGEREGENTLRVLLDFVIPGYRDLKIGSFLFSKQAEFFRSRGIERIVSAPGTREHERYLRRMGFTPLDQERAGSLYVCTVG
ncbi:MAG: hypothetical protein ACR2H9_08795 [Longimicrobiaceae bacterium]